MKNYPKCKKCGKQTGDPESKQCKSCYLARGRTFKKYYCKCGKEISITSANFGGGRCRKCANEQHSLKMMGKNNPNYIDGRKSIQKRIRDHNKYKKWIYKVFKRDNYTCQMCDKTNCHLHVHHKIPLITIILLYRITNLVQALNCPLLWDINWAITLCIACHNKIEKQVYNQKEGITL